MTAWNALSHPNAKPGDTVLLHGTGGVSIFALQFAKACGDRVIITSSRDGKLARARDLGADEIVGGDNLSRSLEALRHSGHIAVVGFLGGRQSPIDLVALNLKRATLHGLSVGSRQDFEDRPRAIDQNGIRPVIDRVFPFDEAAAAFRYIESTQHLGKVVVEL